MAVDAAQPLDRVEEPRLAADREIEAAVAVGDDVEPGGLLGVDDGGDGVEILLAEQRVAHRRLNERPSRLASNHSGRGYDPVIAVGRTMSRVVVSIARSRSVSLPRLFGEAFEPAPLPIRGRRRTGWA